MNRSFNASRAKGEMVQTRGRSGREAAASQAGHLDPHAGRQWSVDAVGDAAESQ
ncbi:MAG: hypothetical protein ACT4NU_04215 [Chromatiales bacterium]